MTTHERAENLFIEAERLGMDRPSEGMIANAFCDVEANTWNEIIYELIEGGFERAAKYLENMAELKKLDEQEP